MLRVSVVGEHIGKGLLRNPEEPLAFPERVVSVEGDGGELGHDAPLVCRRRLAREGARSLRGQGGGRPDV